MITMSFRRILTAGFAAAVLTAGALVAGAAGARPADQTPDAKKTGQAPAQDESFGEIVNVSVVNVDVFVTDEKGNRINDLKREDFEVYEDKRPVAITNFYAV